MRRLLSVAALLGVLAAPAQAEITITQAEYAAGVLVVRGETSRSNQRVVLDGRYDTRTDRNKQFRFRIRYLPPGCSISIRAGQQVRPARIANCDPDLARPGFAPRNVDRSPVTSEPGVRMRVVRQSCAQNEECRVLCAEDEFAVNAFCGGGDAKLLNERTVRWGLPTGGQIVAYCLAPAKIETR